MRRKLRVRLGVLVGAAALMSACAVGPDYHRPSAEVPAAWQPEAPWQQATPADAQVKGDWWLSFADPVLTRLVEQALAANQNLKVAAARLDQARAQLQAARADLFPTVDLSASAARAKSSANRPLSSYSSPNQSQTNKLGAESLADVIDTPLRGSVCF